MKKGFRKEESMGKLVKDWSQNLSTWAYSKGYRLQGGQGTYDDLFLYKNKKVVKSWNWMNRVPNIIELEEEIERYESSNQWGV